MKVDMSPKAVKNRLKMVSQLWRLSIELGKAKKESDAKKKNKDVNRNSTNESVKK